MSSAWSNADAHMMQRFSNSADDWEDVVEHTLREEQEGQALWQKLQTRKTACADLNDEGFAVLGEYFMGQMTGESHAAMNAMMIQMHGGEREEQIHIVMGKRLSGCDTSASLPEWSGGWMPMMTMMGGWSSPFGFGSLNNMMNFGTFGFFGWLWMILWWLFVIGVLVFLAKWVAGQFRGGDSTGPTTGKSALDILKERHARGEIGKQEFEEKKRDLG